MTSTRVLVVDDEEMLRKVCVRALQQAGHQVDSAADGRAAAALLAEVKYDAIVSDISMPGMDGLQLLRLVRERDLDVPVLLMTGNPAVETAIGAIQHGALRYLVKPFGDQVLREEVAQAVRLHQLARLKREALDLLGGGKRIGDLAGLQASFDRALGSIWMAFQPIVSWPEQRIYAYEALLRSNEPELPHPGAIVEAAERLGRLGDLGRAIRRQVAGAAESAPDELFFVNLHPRDLLDDQLYSPQAPLSQVARRVVLEITERSALDEVTDTGRRVAELRGLGFRIAVDDLGAGYAGLTSFAQLEPEVVKFDMTLVRDLHQHIRKRMLIKSMVALFRDMGLKVIAEGVEVAEERDALVECGCELLQGYLFARPAPGFPAVRY